MWTPGNFSSCKKLPTISESPTLVHDRKLTNPAGIRILRHVGANVGVQVRSAVSTETMRPAFITKRTAGDNIPYFSVNQSPISSTAITPSTEAGHVNVSPSGRLPPAALLPVAPIAGHPLQPYQNGLLVKFGRR